MAGDWIKMRGNLWDDPRVSKLCDLTGCGEAQIIGGLYWLWAMADTHTEDGILPGLTTKAIDRKTGVPGLGGALCAIGWLADNPDGVRIVNSDARGLLFLIGYDRLRPGASGWMRLRLEVFDRDGWRCVYCGGAGALECDHILPIAKGGGHQLANLATACFSCNRSKGAKTIEQWKAARHG